MKIIITAILVLISISNLYAEQNLKEIDVVASPIIEAEVHLSKIN